jgi:hypothetical protein
VTIEDQLLVELARRARQVEPRPADIETILQRSHNRMQPAVRSWQIALVGLIAVLLATLAVPATRTALANAIDSFFGGQVPHHAITGEPLTGKQVPRWLASQTDHALVIAGKGNNRLIAYRNHGQYCFAIGSGVGLCSTARSWAHQLAQKPTVLYGPTPAGTLYGLTRGDVASVRITFKAHPAVTASAHNGGFAINTNSRWSPQWLHALDANRQTITSIHLTSRRGTF